ncbi:hypothetical protein DVH24_003503 [Malus domestica]|uniref:NAD(P)H dehydrogenase (quinone) n=1 Tax=Malus domestica TaxID=3750 RepID=A0A498ILI2_MALDO|nr:hypothetical protein DVH24_003503 [Malus domestica]
MYGHVGRLAEEIKKGASSVEGVEATLWQVYLSIFCAPVHCFPSFSLCLALLSSSVLCLNCVRKIDYSGLIKQVPETLPEEVLGKMSAPPKSDAPIISPNELADADGFVFGFPTRFGMMAAQFKAFLDATGGLWRTQQLAGKPAGIFYSTGSQGGGQETTALTAITQLVHHGMVFVPIGYTFGVGMFEMENIKGGSPYGAGTYAGDGSRQPSQLELEQAFHQGKYIATITKKLKGAA